MTEPSFTRTETLERLRTEHFDVVVIGGGITGAGVALDAASRGLSVALVERDDFASGTSSKSSKMVHGGLRYLQQGDVRLVYEALRERRRIMRNAPHLVRTMPFLLPVFARDGLIPKKLARALGSAMWMYDLTGGWRIGRRHRRLTADAAHAHMPTLRSEKLASGYLYYDAVTDDARLVLCLLRTAALDHGAAVANRVRAVGLTKTADTVVHGVQVEVDRSSGSGVETFEIATRSVVNAAGVWADDVRAWDDGAHPESIRPAKGIHVTVPWDRLRNDIATIIPVAKDRRSVFVVPWGEFAYIGTTDTDYDGSLDDPQCTPHDIAYLLDAVNAVTGAGLTVDDVTATWAGLRPLVRSATSGRTADLSRRHHLRRSPTGVLTITGGKLTTYREMAEDTVDELVDQVLGAAAPAHAGRCRTRRLALRGATGHETVGAAAATIPGVTPEAAAHLAGRYGAEARAVMGLIAHDPSLGDPLIEGLPYLRAEAIFAARHEMVSTLDDLLSRRTRARLLARDDSAAAAEAVAALIGTELGWDAARQAAEAGEYRALIAHERASADLPEVLLATALHATTANPDAPTGGDTP